MSHGRSFPLHRLLVVAAGSLVLALATGQAGAQHLPGTVFETHWEVLGRLETATVSGGVPISRGTLPGGTSKFEPAPTVTLEVVAKVTGAVGSGTPWNVVLRSGGTDLAAVGFASADTSPTLRTASFSWPSSDKPLTELFFDRLTGLSAGTLEVRKAYLKLHQEGAIKKAVGRYPIGHAASVANLGFDDLSAPVLYRHDGADFDPAPAVRLRVGATGIVGEARARLVTEAGSAVSGSEFVLGTGSTESGSLSLANGTRYKLEVKGNFSLLGADLVFEQSTTDTHGLIETVGFYAGVTVPSDIISADVDLGFGFRIPAVTARERTNTWLGSLTRTAGGNRMGVRLVDATTGSELSSISTTSSSLSYQEASAAAGTAGAVGISFGFIDTSATSSSSDPSTQSDPGPTTGTVSHSLLRVRALLRDVVPPTITNWRISQNPQFSPNGDGSKDTTTFAATLSDISPPVTWTITVRDSSSGETVRTASGSTTLAVQSMSWTWDGKNGSGQVVTDGTYSATLSATDDVGNTATSSSVSVVVDTVPPSVTNVSVTPTRFSPNGDGYLDTATFTGSISESLPWTLRIKTSPGGSTVRTYTGTGSSVTQAWNGLSVSDGDYVGELEAYDAAGNRGVGTSGIVTRDTTGAVISGYQATLTAFSPNGDGVKESTTFSASLSDPWLPLSWELKIKTSLGVVVRSYSGSGGSVSQAWDGKDAGGNVVEDGLYTATLYGIDGGLSRSSQNLIVEVDTVAATPALMSLPNPLTPNGDGVEDSTTLTASTDETSTWTLTIKNASGTTVRSFSGSGEEMSQHWDGKNASGTVQPSGVYTAEVTFTDPTGNSAKESRYLTIGAGPVVTGITPSVAEVGKEIVITGTGFAPQFADSVMVGDRAAYTTSWTATQIRTRVPFSLSPGTVEVSVWTAGLSSWPVEIEIPNYSTPSPGETFLQGKIVFKVAPATDPTAVAIANGDPPSAVTAEFTGTNDADLARWYGLAVASGTETSRTLAYAGTAGVEWAEVPALDSYHASPNDEKFQNGKQWGLHNTGQTINGQVGIDDMDLDAPEAWDITSGSSSIVIAVIDAGVGSHEDLDGNRVGSVQTACANSDNHGMMVAGVAAARTNNSIGIAGTGWNTKFRSYKLDCDLNTSSQAQAIDQARLNGDDVIVQSVGGYTGCRTKQRQEAIEAAWGAGIVIVASAGNDNTDEAHCPAAYDYVLGVGAYNNQGDRWSSSNYGAWVDVFAPGQDIWTLRPGNNYDRVNGTSFAAPYAAGIAALMKAEGSLGNCGIYKSIATQVYTANDVTDGTRKANAHLALRDKPPCRTYPSGTWVQSRFSSPQYDGLGNLISYDAGQYWIDTSGTARPVLSNRVRDSWGPRRTISMFDVEFLQLTKGIRMGFRPGTVVATNDITGDAVRYAITNEGGWISGKRYRLLPTTFTCLGYKDSAVIRIPSSELSLHADGGDYLFCDRLPGGTIVKTGTTYWMIEGSTKRQFPNATTRDSWGITENQALGLANVAVQNWFDNLGAGSIAFQPGSIIRTGGSSGTKYFITASGTFALGNRRQFSGAKAFGDCYQYSSSWIVETTTTLRNMHPASSDLTC